MLGRLFDRARPQIASPIYYAGLATNAVQRSEFMANDRGSNSPISGVDFCNIHSLSEVSGSTSNLSRRIVNVRSSPYGRAVAQGLAYVDHFGRPGR